MSLYWSGIVEKMRVEHNDPVSYWFTDAREDDHEGRPNDEPVNGLIGATVTLKHTGRIECVGCGRKIKKTFAQGFCFPCMRSRPDADMCMMKPEQCHYFEDDNPCRDDAFAKRVCFQPHVLYLSLTSGFKIGITRQVNVPSRWIDQGAVSAIPLAVLPSRREVGLVEVQLAERFADKTHWQKMLKTKQPEGDIQETSQIVLSHLKDMNVSGILSESQRDVHHFHYPVSEYPQKVKSFNLDKTPEVGGTLVGIKGQYLIFDAGVINLRKYTGYELEVHHN